MAQTFDMPTYYIYRDDLPGQSGSPESLVFVPPKDSDELFDALRNKYPHLRSHSERMREAVIEFLITEPQIDQMLMEQDTIPFPTSPMLDSTTTSPWYPSLQSFSSGSSTWSSPDTLDLATPTFGNSPQPQHQRLGSQVSTAAPSAAPSTASSPPALEQMTGVFSFSDSAQPKQRIRRKMTDAEKLEYRKRRIVKACEKCSKRKRKCIHNQPEMESISTKTNKIAKLTTIPQPAPKKQPPLPKIQEAVDDVFGQDIMNLSNSFAGDAQNDDFDYVLNDPFPEMTFDDLISPQQQQWPWSDTADWTLMDSTTNSPTNTYNSQPEYQCDPRSQQSQAPNDFNQLSYGDPITNDDLQLQLQSEGTNGANVLSDFWRTDQDRLETLQPTHTLQAHDNELNGTFRYDGNSLSPRQDANSRHLAHLGGEHLAAASAATERLSYRQVAENALLNGESDSVGLNRTPDNMRLAQQSEMQQTGGTLWFEGENPRVLRFIDHYSGKVRQPIEAASAAYESLLRSQPAAGGALPQVKSSSVVERRENDDLPSQQQIQRQQAGRADGNAATPHQELHLSRSQQTGGALPQGESSAVDQNRENHDSQAVQEPSRRKQTSGADGVAISRPELQVQPTNRPRALPNSLLRSGSPRSELYMLRRRIPSSLEPLPPLRTQTSLEHQQEAVISRNTICTEGNATQVNGGAYQRLDSGNYNSPLSEMTGAANYPDLPSSNTSGYGSVRSFGQRSMGADSIPYENSSVLYEVRLRDTMRRRDHFGRDLSASELAPAAATTLLSTVLGISCLLLVLAFLAPGQSINTSVLLLALISQETSGAEGSKSGLMGTFMRWSNRKKPGLAGRQWHWEARQPRVCS